MTEAQVLEHITSIVQRMLEDKGVKAATIEPGTELLGGAINIDSLDRKSVV